MYKLVFSQSVLVIGRVGHSGGGFGWLLTRNPSRCYANRFVAQTSRCLAGAYLCGTVVDSTGRRRSSGKAVRKLIQVAPSYSRHWISCAYISLWVTLKRITYFKRTILREDWPTPIFAWYLSVERCLTLLQESTLSLGMVYLLVRGQSWPKRPRYLLPIM